MKSLFLTVFTLFMSFTAFNQELSKEEVQSLAKEQTAELSAIIRLEPATEQLIHNYNITAIFNRQQLEVSDLKTNDPGRYQETVKMIRLERDQAIRNAIPIEQHQAFDDFAKTSKYYQSQTK